MRVRVCVVTGLSVIVGMVFLAVSGVLRTLDIQETSLYKRLGGEVAVEGVVNDFLTNVDDDDRLGVRFTDIEMDWLSAFLDEWVCETGGSCHTDSRGRSQADEGVAFTEDAVDLITSHFSGAMRDAGIAGHEHAEGVHLFADMLTMSSFLGDG